MIYKNLFISFSITVVYAVITLITALHHEVWADEAQVWQLCSHLSLPALFNHLQNEGHPALFYLLIMPFAKLFDDIIWMKLFCWFFMCSSLFLFWNFSPFNYFTKSAITFSSGFLYFLPVLARNYSIIPCFVFLTAILYSKRKEHPVLYASLLILIANSHIIMYVFSFCLGILFFLEKIYEKKSLFILAIGLLLPVIQLLHTTESNSFINLDFSTCLNSLFRVILLFFANPLGENIFTYNTFNFIFIICLLCYFIMLFILLKADKKFFVITFTSIAFQIAVYVFTYSYFIYVNRIFCAHLILIFSLWCSYALIKAKEKLILNVVMTIFFGITAFNGINSVNMEMEIDYSGAKQAAEFIQNNINPQNSVLLTDNEPYNIALAYYLRNTHKIYSVFRKRNLDYVIWDKTMELSYNDYNFRRYIEELSKTDTNKEYYLVDSITYKPHNVDKTEKNFFELIYSSKEETIEKFERYKIFKYKKQ